MTSYHERLELFEARLDSLAEVFCPDERWDDLPSGTVLYGRCERKRFRIGKACARNPAKVRRHADLVLAAIVRDENPSGIRQLVAPLVAAAGPRPVMGHLLACLESGSSEEWSGSGVTSAWYWALPSLQYATFEDMEADAHNNGGPTPPASVAVGTGLPAPVLGNREVHTLRLEMGVRYRNACLRAFLAADDAETCRELSFHFTLDTTDYPDELHAEVEAARRVADAHPERYQRWAQGRD